MKEKAIESRTPNQIIILGTNGTGKTTLTKQLVLNEIRKQGSHVLVVVPDDMEWNSLPWVHPAYTYRIERYVKARKICYYEGLLPVIKEKFRDGLLLLDDCRAYFSAAMDKDLASLLIRRRQMMMDIIAVGHGFTEVPPRMFTFATHFILFKTIDNIDRRKNVIPNFDILKEAQIRINKKAETDPHYYEIIKV